MSGPRKPVFGFLWPAASADGPVDGDYRQVRRVRVAARGPIRILALAALGLLTVSVLGTALIAGLTMGIDWPTMLLAALGATGLALELRGWVVGTYVTDDAVIVETLLHRHVLPWSSVTAINWTDADCPLLGLPVRVRGTRSHVMLRSGEVVPTHIYTSSPDLWLRAEATDAACIRLENWQQQR